MLRQRNGWSLDVHQEKFLHSSLVCNLWYVYVALGFIHYVAFFILIPEVSGSGKIFVMLANSVLYTFDQVSFNLVHGLFFIILVLTFIMKGGHLTWPVGHLIKHAAL